MRISSALSSSSAEERRKPGAAALLGAWVAAAVATSLASSALSTALVAALPPSLARLAATLLAATLLGLAQWLALRATVGMTAAWIPVTAVTAFLANSLVGVLAYALAIRLGMADLLVATLILAERGVLAFAQWFLLRRRSERAGWWIAGLPAAYALMLLPRSVLGSLGAMGLVPFALSTAAEAALTGALLAWILYNPAASAPTSQSSR